jgi:NAD(P)-dependent dehydrogenase (short-subunit alcohol dehydrogenase family)
MRQTSNYLIFGSSGAIGSACVAALEKESHAIRGSRNLLELQEQIHKISFLNGVVWAQGVNLEDNADTFSISEFGTLIDANVTFIINSLQILKSAGKLQAGTQLVVLSSIWGIRSRPNKLSYGISKAAIGGLIRSLAIELGPIGVQINSVSPGPIASPMTSRNLKPEELNRVISETPIRRLVTIDEVSSLVSALATGQCSGVTGQDIVIDGGWSDSKLV